MKRFSQYLGRVQWHVAVMAVLLLGLVGCHSETAVRDYGAGATEGEIDFDKPPASKPRVVVKYKEEEPPVPDGIGPPEAMPDPAANGYLPPLPPAVGWIEIGGNEGEANRIATIEITVNEIPAPDVSDLSLLIVPSMNNLPAVATLTATVSGSTSCKYIDEDRFGFINAESWQYVEAAFNSPCAINCPSFVTPAAIGNWSTNWNTGNTFVIIWANTVKHLSSYTTAIVSP